MHRRLAGNLFPEIAGAASRLHYNFTLWRTSLRSFPVIVVVCFAAAAAAAQNLSPDVRQFVKVDAPVVALTHVRVIDGTGSSARDDQKPRTLKRRFALPCSATPMAHYGDLTVAARKKVGKGQVYYFGTNLGASINGGDDAGITLLRAIIGGVVQPAAHSARLRPRLIEGSSSRSLLVVVNDTPQDVADEVALPARYRRATDIHSGKPLPMEKGSVRVAVPYQDAVVLRLE